MQLDKSTAKIEISLEIESPYNETLTRLGGVLDIIDTLHRLELRGEGSTVVENALFGDITNGLADTACLLPEKPGLDLRKQIGELRGGIRDLYAVGVKKNGCNYLLLILGKVFSTQSGNEPRWSGVLGIANRRYDELIAEFDGKIRGLLDVPPLNNYPLPAHDLENACNIKCVDVLRFGGELNGPHKPICVFYSGGCREKLSTLSNMVVFINLYTARFEAITKELAMKHFSDPEGLCDIDEETVSKLLILWLRGHDLGHFIGADNLAERMGELNPYYQIVHELRSDAASLFFMKHLEMDALGSGWREKAYLVTLAEMLRYIRRGSFSHYPDSASAYLAFRYLCDGGSIKARGRENTLSFDLGRLEENVEELLSELLDIFDNGDESRAIALVNRWGALTTLDPSALPNDVEFLLENSVPHYIEIAVRW